MMMGIPTVKAVTLTKSGYVLASSSKPSSVGFGVLNDESKEDVG